MGGLDGERAAEQDGNSSLVTALLKMAGVSSSCSSERFLLNLNENKLLCFALRFILANSYCLCLSHRACLKSLRATSAWAGPVGRLNSPHVG